MLITNLALGLGTYYAISKKSRTLVPPNISKAFTISDGSFDEAYLELISEFLIHKKLNVTPANVHRQYGLLLDYVNAENWSKIQPRLLREANHIKAENISSHFDVTKVDIALDDLKVRFTGTLQKHVGSRALEPEMVTYEVSLSYEQAEISLHSINRLEKKT